MMQTNILKIGALLHSKKLPVNTFKHTEAQHYEFIENSVIPTYHFQKSLPRLPIPPLEKSCERYLNALRPILDDAQFETSKRIVASFQKTIGKELHKQLLHFDNMNRHTSYISKPWYESYLKSRDSIMLNYNPFLVFATDPNKIYQNQVIRATNLVISSLRFMKSLRNEILEPEIYHTQPERTNNKKFKQFLSWLPFTFACYGAYLFQAYPLDMSQYKSLFNTTRIPCVNMDKLHQNIEAQHLIVLRHGHFYIFDVLDSTGAIYPPQDIQSCLQSIVDLYDSPPTYPLAVLTSEQRNEWASVRTQLLNLGNEKNLNLIDDALFCLCLDDDSNLDLEQQCSNFLHGNGTNRWFDKSFSLIVNKDGNAAVNFEHSWGDGVAVLRYMQDVYLDSISQHFIDPVKSYVKNPTVKIQRLDFRLDDNVCLAINKAKEHFQKCLTPFQLCLYNYSEMNKNFFDKIYVRGDAVMQLGFQCAYYKLKQMTVATYESASTAGFKHGRTETLRSATMETKQFAKNLYKNELNVKQLKQMMFACFKRHAEITKEAVLGQGFDRHFFALKYLAESHNIPLPHIFLDEGYHIINHNILSTSTLTRSCVLAGGFGPVVPDGFGIGYGTLSDSLGCVITSYSTKQNCSAFIECLNWAYDQILQLLVSK